MNMPPGKKPFIYNPPMKPYLSLVHYDNDIVVANKQSGLLSVTGIQPAHKDALISRVQKVLPTATVVHRLDMATSGIMVMALNKEAHRQISRQFQDRLTKKRYYARVDGIVAEDEGEVTLPLIVDWPNRPKQKVDHENGKPSLTYYRVIRRLENETWVELLPVTGRSHQLRVHMLSIGHPILGDRLYAHDEARDRAPRLQLHAETLILQHPASGQWQRFTAHVPFMDYRPEPLALPE
ncbi:pseudouridine synthase [Alteromonas confluentis]|uniref:Dual-specificity RNA pseudouridine synthase RluA n=1 Tax=Alteromonas confluentis TaxID=1656094 RepID=A0A1E7ZB21_9ALTE|nr:pseudouridine synthase [Alteromonas confluentis]OFC70700.1 RNA pseudouridine synthase [Alteromonas confluentis]